MELKGKKVAFLGDSITEGYGASCLENTYWKTLGRMTGAEVYGYGIGGTRIAIQQIPTPEPNRHKDQYFASRVDSMIPDADVVVIFGGTNDFGDGDPAFGKMEVAGFYGIPVVDLFRTCPIQPRFEPQRQLLMPDGVHPNDAGHRIIARRLISAMKAL